MVNTILRYSFIQYWISISIFSRVGSFFFRISNFEIRVDRRNRFSTQNALFISQMKIKWITYLFFLPLFLEDCEELRKVELNIFRFSKTPNGFLFWFFFEFLNFWRRTLESSRVALVEEREWEYLSRLWLIHNTTTNSSDNKEDSRFPAVSLLIIYIKQQHNKHLNSMEELQIK